MVDPDETILEDARRRGETLLIDEFLVLIERHHPDENPGVGRETLAAYDEAAAAADLIPFDSGDVIDLVDDRLVTDETWRDPDAIYALSDDRVSSFPAAWHDRLGGTTDLRAYVDVIGEATADEDAGAGAGAEAPSSSATGATGMGGGIGTGVPEQLLLDAVSVVGDLDRATAKDRLETLRGEGELIEDADQHPDARVYLHEEVDAEVMRDDTLDT